ncbi:hypothetical protein DFR67_11629 [Williamsia limnetica]|uniref:Antitoxin VbhA domain-containing protein n=1 Tax=Williamsia limnetica TaxID=882452 RepID=A0A318RPB7_WILLI|nr:hypothetical protein [Williamsia limnetica]PYE13475.1 hypothetical protein DFR67_11629 [Williamsia limnetica]
MADESLTPREQRILAGVNAGEVMETGTELSEKDIAAVLRVARGQSTAEDERDRMLAEIRAAREERENDDE